jgi:integrase
MMKDARDMAGYAGIANPPTFHTVRSLANSLAKNAQESKEAIQKNNAHKSVDTQLIYQEGHDLPFDNAPIQFTADQIGGNFK